MDIFSQKKFLLRMVIILAILNIALIGVFWWRYVQKDAHARPPRANQQELSEILQKELNLTNKQAEDLKQIRMRFLEEETQLSNKVRNERDSMNLMMFGKNENYEQLKVLASSVSENEYKMELLRIEQAKQFRSICTPDQLVKLEKLVKEIRDYLKPDDR